MAHPCREKREKKQAEKSIWEEKVREALKSRDSRDPLRVKTKKKTYDYFLSTYPLITQYKDFWIRKPEEWVAKSHNETRQTISFLMWMFCIYKPPMFLFSLWDVDKSHYRRPEYGTLWDIFISWFIDIAQGASFQKTAATVLTKKEAHMFLLPPKVKDEDIIELILMHIIWVKCKVRNLPDNISLLIASKLSDKVVMVRNKISYNTTTYPSDIVTKDKCIDFYTKQLLDFFAKSVNDPLFTIDTIETILDFFNINFTFKEISTFSLKGRSLNSVVQLSNQWHYHQAQLKGAEKAAWPGLPIDNFEFVDNNNITWRIIQLKTSTSLLVEGRRMHHCVSGYVRKCMENRCAIFSVSNDFNGKIATIEVSNNKYIQQIKGPCNKKVTGIDRKMINRWASEKNLKIESWVT